MPIMYCEIVMPPSTTPSGPSPTMSHLRKIIAVRGATCAILEVIARDHHNTLGAAIALEQFPTVPKKAQIGEAIVLQDDRLLHLLEGPVQSARDTATGAHVGVGEIPEYLARPVNTVYNAARFCA